MSLTPTTQIPLGFKAPDFSLFDTISQKEVSLSELASDKGTVIMFICNHCPFVKHMIQGLIDLANDYIPQGISFIAISSNDVKNYPQDSPELMREEAARLEYPFPYLYDETQEVARAYSAACTPDFNIFDGELKCVYRGQLDDSRPGNGIPVSGKDMRTALDALLKSEEIRGNQTPSVGCNIKWKY
jgi:thiol-disulfide isomerase/thioredoxin